MASWRGHLLAQWNNQKQRMRDDGASSSTARARSSTSATISTLQSIIVLYFASFSPGGRSRGVAAQSGAMGEGMKAVDNALIGLIGDEVCPLIIDAFSASVTQLCGLLTECASPCPDTQSTGHCHWLLAWWHWEC